MSVVSVCNTCPFIDEEENMAEPEVVFHVLCPAGDGGAGVMELKQTLDDAAGRQRRYACPYCGTEITVNFPPVNSGITLYEDSHG